MLATSSSGSVTGATDKTMFAVIAAAAHRPKVKRIILGLIGASTDAMAEFAIRRFTADGTGSAGTVMPCDPGDGTPTCTTKTNYTVEPTTYTAGNLYVIPMHYRSTVIWTPPDNGLVTCPVGTANGITIQMKSNTVLAYDFTIEWDE